jgi:Flp pilus assembly protein TadG
MKTFIRLKKRLYDKLGQSFVEFALILPFLLLLLSGIIEFSYAFYTWVALQEVARIGSRYAVTGQYDVQYCLQADNALNPYYPGIKANDFLDGTYDCTVPSTASPLSGNLTFDQQTSILQDWARLPSIRDAALHGGAGMLFNPASGISGDYLQFLSNPAPYSGFSTSYRGNPTANGYINISVCSSRAVAASVDSNPHYFNGVVNRENQYFGVCTNVLPLTDYSTSNVFYHRYFIDDAGGPGDRVRVYVTYNHPLILPFFAALWPNLKMTTSQDGVVEKFRVSRVSGGVGPISALPTQTLTPSITPTASATSTSTSTPLPTATSTPTKTYTATYVTPTFTSTITKTPTITNTPTKTNTPTITLTPTSTPQPCPTNTGTGLRGDYYGNYGAGLDIGGPPGALYNFTNMLMSRIDPTVNFSWSSNPDAPTNHIGADNFQVRWTGSVSPPYPGNYIFDIQVDDGGMLYIDNMATALSFAVPPSAFASAWRDQSAKDYYTAAIPLDCTHHLIKYEFYEHTGSAVARLWWAGGMLPNNGVSQVIQQIYLYPPGGNPPPTAVNTLVPTATSTATKTNTATITLTPTPTTIPSATNTATVTRTSTITFTSLPPTATFTPSTTPSPTRTPSPTITPTKCQTSTELGGCKTPTPTPTP